MGLIATSSGAGQAELPQDLQPVTQGNYPCLVLNADYQPLSYFPLSLWSWQDAVKAVFLDRVNVVDGYQQVVRAASFEMELPSVVALFSAQLFT